MFLTEFIYHKIVHQSRACMIFYEKPFCEILQGPLLGLLRQRFSRDFTHLAHVDEGVLTRQPEHAQNHVRHDAGPMLSGGAVDQNLQRYPRRCLPVLATTKI